MQFVVLLLYSQRDRLDSNSNSGSSNHKGRAVSIGAVNPSDVTHMLRLLLQ